MGLRGRLLLPLGCEWDAMHCLVMGESLGLLFDTDLGGSVSVYKDGERVGPRLQAADTAPSDSSAEGGAICWAIELPDGGDAVRMEAQTVPLLGPHDNGAAPYPASATKLLHLPVAFSGARSSLDASNRPCSHPSFPATLFTPGRLTQERAMSSGDRAALRAELQRARSLQGRKGVAEEGEGGETKAELYETEKRPSAPFDRVAFVAPEFSAHGSVVQSFPYGDSGARGTPWKTGGNMLQYGASQGNPLRTAYRVETLSNWPN